jgi:hypothetical protein
MDSPESVPLRATRESQKAGIIDYHSASTRHSVLWVAMSQMAAAQGRVESRSTDEEGNEDVGRDREVATC